MLTSGICYLDFKGKTLNTTTPTTIVGLYEQIESNYGKELVCTDLANLPISTPITSYALDGTDYILNVTVIGIRVKQNDEITLLTE